MRNHKTVKLEPSITRAVIFRGSKVLEEFFLALCDHLKMTTVHSFKMFGTSHPVTQHYISEQNPVLNREIVQYGLLLPGNGDIEI